MKALSDCNGPGVIGHATKVAQIPELSERYEGDRDPRLRPRSLGGPKVVNCMSLWSHSDRVCSLVMMVLELTLDSHEAKCAVVHNLDQPNYGNRKMTECQKLRDDHGSAPRQDLIVQPH